MLSSGDRPRAPVGGVDGLVAHDGTVVIIKAVDAPFGSKVTADQQALRGYWADL